MKKIFLIALSLVFLCPRLTFGGDKDGGKAVKIEILGAVVKPGKYEVSTTSTVQQLLQLAGGFKAVDRDVRDFTYYKVKIDRGEEMFQIRQGAWGRTDLAAYPLKAGDKIEFPPLGPP